jgi:hypothetical protein
MPNWSGSSLAWRRDWISECSSGDREAHILAAVPPRAAAAAARWLRLGRRRSLKIPHLPLAPVGAG